MVTNGAATLKFVYLEGEMTTKDVQSLLLYQNASGYVSPARVYQRGELESMGIHMPDMDWDNLQKTFKSDEWKKFVKDIKELSDSSKLQE